MPHLRHTLIVLFCSAVAVANGQPYRYGCHYFRNQGDHHPVPTAQEKNQIDETIARSDTFDILHYDINIDVTDYTNDLITAATTITYSPLMAGQDFIRFDLLVKAFLDHLSKTLFRFDWLDKYAPSTLCQS